MNQFYKRLLLAIAVMTAGGAHAQQQASTSFTLEQCIEYALINSVSAQNAIIDQEIAAAKVKETTGLGLPQIDGSVALVHNAKLQRFFTTYNPSSGSNFLGDLSGIPGIQAGDVVAAQNFFQLKNSGSASLSINQLLFSGSYLVGLKASKAYRALSYKSTDVTREQIVQQVTKAYYLILINKERIGLFTNSIARLDSLLKSTTALYKNGFVESIDVDRIKVAYNNLKSENEKFLNLNELGIQLLKFQMNYPTDQPLELLGSIQDVKVEVNSTNYTEGWDYKTRADYKVLEANRRLQELSVRNQYAGALPFVSAFGNLGYNTQSADFGGLFATNSQIADQSGLGPDKWYDFSQFGLSLSVPIFNGLQRQHKIQQEKLTLKKIDNGFRTLKLAIDLETKQASIGFENAIVSLLAQKENMDLANNVARVTKIKYEQGVGSNLEVVDAENSLRQAQTSYYTSLFDAMIAKVDLDKAYGKLIPLTAKN